MKMMKNACMALMCSRGTPMFLAGDEFGDTRFGNNNPYCQDNEISWLDWKRLDTNREIYRFFKKMIWFRREHAAIRNDLSPSETGLPAVSIHTERPFRKHMSGDVSRTLPWTAGKRRITGRRLPSTLCIPGRRQCLWEADVIPEHPYSKIKQRCL